MNTINKESVDSLKFVVGKAVHSCNNHLSTIITSCDLLMNQYTGEVLHKCNVIKNRCKLMAEQLKALRQFSMLGESDMLMLNSIGSLCEKVFLEHLSLQNPNSPIELKNEISTDTELHSPVMMTEILFGELIKNSIQSLTNSTVENKIIILSSQNLSDRLVIEISDNGPEMDEEVKDYMFSPFYSSRTSDAGMGLSIVKQALLLMNGHIFFERKNNLNIFKVEFNKIADNL